MTSRRLAIAGVTALVGLLALTACVSNTKTNSTPTATTSVAVLDAPSPSPTVDLAVVLRKAVAVLKSTGYDFQLTQQGLSGPGGFDPAKKAATMQLKGSEAGVDIEVDMRQIGSDAWVKVDAGSTSAALHIPSSWIKIDPKKLDKSAGAFDLSGKSDPLDITVLMATATDLTTTDGMTITGTVDMTKSPTNGEEAAHAKDGTAVKFTATLDAQGHLADLKFSSSDSALNSEFVFSNYGSPTPITPPTGKVVKATTAVYNFLNGS